MDSFKLFFNFVYDNNNYVFISGYIGNIPPIIINIIPPIIIVILFYYYFEYEKYISIYL